MRKSIQQSAAMTFPGLSQAIRVGDLIFVSGQVALDDSANLVGEDDPGAQAEQCFANLERLLELAGSSIGDVVKLTVFLADASVYPHYASAKLRRFPGTGPTGTAVTVAALAHPSFLLEVEAVAVVDPN